MIFLGDEGLEIMEINHGRGGLSTTKQAVGRWQVGEGIEKDSVCLDMSGRGESQYQRKEGGPRELVIPSSFLFQYFATQYLYSCHYRSLPALTLRGSKESGWIGSE